MAWLSDEEYIYRQDIKEKKAAGRGASHKKCGSKSKKCTLPSDYMTRKEKMAMNGEVMTYNPNAWYTWEEFKKLPMEYQVKYVNSLLNKYNCGLTSISSVVFNRCKSCLQQHFRDNKQLDYINGPKRGERIDYRKGKAALKKAMERDLWPNRDEEIQIAIQEKIKQAQDAVELYESKGISMTPEQINKIYEEKAGMSFAKAMNYLMKTNEEHQGEEPFAIAESILEQAEDSMDVKSFSIIMDHIDMGIIQYVSGLFGEKKIAVTLEVKEVL